MGKQDRANQTYGEIAAKIASKTNGYDRLRFAAVYYDLAKSQTEQKDFGAVYDSYAKVVAPASDATADERADSHIWMGMILDSQNKRKEALEHYDAVAKLDCRPVYKDKAADYKRKAYKP